MYNQFFSFTQSPFSIAPNPAFLYQQEQYAKALAVLEYGLTYRGGFVLLTGEVGTGKTTLCRHMLNHIPQDVNLALVLNPQLNPLELMQVIFREFGIEAQKDAGLRELQDKFNEYLLGVYAAGRHAVLIIDEAQQLADDVLELIRLLTNLETDECKLLQIILLGQPELRARLDKYSLRQLNQRITARHHLLPLTARQTAEYVRHRLSVVGGDVALFSKGALRRLYRCSAGVPRLINVIADRALMGAYARDRLQVTAGMVEKAAVEVVAAPLPVKTHVSRWNWLWLPPLASAVVIAMYFWLPLPAFLLQKNPPEIASQSVQVVESVPEVKSEMIAPQEIQILDRVECAAPVVCWQGSMPDGVLTFARIPVWGLLDGQWQTWQPGLAYEGLIVQWAAPADFNGAVILGGRSKIVEQVREMLDMINGAEDANTENWEVIGPEENQFISDQYDWLLQQQVKKFQADYGLDVDGLIGSQTLLAMMIITGKAS